MSAADLGPHFTEDELRCKGSGLYLPHPRFPPLLRHLRHMVARPMRITSACRSTAHNAAVRGAANSYHLLDRPWPDGSIGTLAVDVATPDPEYAWHLMRTAAALGWRVGVASTFVHVDAAAIVLGVPPALWTYA